VLIGGEHSPARWIPSIPMPRLVAVLMPGGPRFVETIQRIWDRGDAVAPLDPSAPDAFTTNALEALAVDAVVGMEGDERHLDGGRPIEDGDALVILSSGTGGAPRGAVLTHDALEASAYMTATSLGVDPSARWLACLPLHHIGGFGVVSRALVTGAGLEVHRGFDADAVTEAARRGATHTSLVTTALARIDPSIFRVILLGGSAIPADRPPNTVATYGMTESCGGVVYDGLVLNGAGLRIDADDRISLSGPTMLRTYRDGTDPKDAAGWLRTSDLGAVDPETGRLTVWGRADDVIVTGGEKVWPDPVEALLRTDPWVDAVAVIGRADAEWGQRVVAVVVPADPSRPPRLDDLRRLVKEHLPAACAPRELELAESLPRTALGKVRRAELR
jgi:O-succinylbenzoic acid--CoA ligase